MMGLLGSLVDRTRIARSIHAVEIMLFLVTETILGACLVFSEMNPPSAVVGVLMEKIFSVFAPRLKNLARGFGVFTIHECISL